MGVSRAPPESCTLINVPSARHEKEHDEAAGVLEDLLTQIVLKVCTKTEN